MDYSRLEDQILLKLIAQTHEGALSELYDRYNRLVYTVALNSSGEAARAEEITQDVFIRVWDKAASYHSEQGRVATWLCSIARNRAIDLYRQGQARQEDRHISWEQAEYLDPPDPQNLEADFEIAQRQRLVRQALAQLSDEQKQALGLAYFQGLSHAEISQELGEPLGTIKTRIRLGLHKLKEILAGEDPVNTSKS